METLVDVCSNVILIKVRMFMIKNVYIKYKEIINYIIVGGLTTVVSLGIYYGLVFTVLDPNNAFQLQVANVASWVGAVTFAYFANRKYVFESNDRHIAKEMTKFYSSRVATLLMDAGIMFVSVTLLGFNDKIMKLIVQVIVTVLNYVFSKLMVFKKKGKDVNNECEI